MLKYLLNKGGAGKALTRQETCTRLEPIIRRFHILNYCYDAALKRIPDPLTKRHLDEMMQTARADAGKISETVLSAGGAPSTGVGLRQDDFGKGIEDDEVFFLLRDREHEFRTALDEEMSVKHHIRTTAVLTNAARNSDARLEFLRGVTRGKRRSAARTDDASVPKTPGNA
jgi:hypothetical protein